MSLPASYDDHCLLIDELDSSFDRHMIEQVRDSLETVLTSDLHTDVLVDDEVT